MHLSPPPTLSDDSAPALQSGTGTRFSKLTQAAWNLALPASLFAEHVSLLTLKPELPAWTYCCLTLAVLAAAGGLLPRGTDYRRFALYIAAFALFNGLRTFADNTGWPVSYAYPIDFGRTVFGSPPSQWLQRHYYEAGRVGPLELATFTVYTSYFSAHYLVGVALWCTRRDLLPFYLKALVATLFLGLVIYFVLPTAPPWLASDHGKLPGVERVVPLVADALRDNTFEQGSRIAGNNEVAAMPSLHTALTVVIAITLARLGRLRGVIGWLYAAAMGFSLVYLGEHYTIDVGAGCLTALAGWKLANARQRQRPALTLIGGELAPALATVEAVPLRRAA